MASDGSNWGGNTPDTLGVWRLAEPRQATLAQKNTNLPLKSNFNNDKQF